LNPFRLSYLFRILIALATIAGAVLVTTGTLALLASLFGMMPFAFVAQLQVPYVGVYVTPYLGMVDGPLTQLVVAQVLAAKCCPSPVQGWQSSSASGCCVGWSCGCAVAWWRGL
jgi:hypothetical protein